MVNRDEKGKFVVGNVASKGFGRIQNSGKRAVKDMTWDKINNIVKLVFDTPEKELAAFLEKNKKTNLLSRGERVFLEASNDVEVLEALLDRIIGKTLIIDDSDARDPLIETLLKIKETPFDGKLEEMINNRKIISAEYKTIKCSGKK